MDNVQVKIPGHSGCLVEIVDNFDEVCIRKSTLDQSYMLRLSAQIAKQKKFSSLFNSVRVPEVYGEYQSPRVYFAEMKYIPALDIFDFIGSANKEKLDKFIEIIEAYLKEALLLSEMTEFPYANFTDKLEDLELNIIKKSPETVGYVRRLKDILKRYTFSPIPVGICHGDLTFSNILIESDCENIYFIDFLDSFVESPIQDIVKIKQDVVYFWSIKKSIQNFDTCRARIIFSYLNKRIDDFIAEQSINKAVVSLFQVVNLLRIIPYTRDFELTNYLLLCIDSEFKVLESAL